MRNQTGGGGGSTKIKFLIKILTFHKKNQYRVPQTHVDNTPPPVFFKNLRVTFLKKIARDIFLLRVGANI